MTRTYSPLRTVRPAAMAAVALLGVLALNSAAAAQCTGDCNEDDEVGINELISGVNIALGLSSVSACAAFDVNGDDTVSISELIAAVSNALNGCGNRPTATARQGTPTPTRTPGGGGTPTFTPTVPTSCGNGNVDFALGETCDDGNALEGVGDSCPANCRIATCETSEDTLTADVIFDTDPSDLLISGLTLFIRYPDGTVDVPGANNDPAVVAAVGSDFFSVTPNDTNFSLTTVLIDPFLIGVNAGTAITVEFTVCQGASPPPAGEFSCRVTDATDADGTVVTDQVSCTVVPR